MSGMFEEVAQALDALGTAVRIRDASAIFGASEALATAVSKAERATQRGAASQHDIATLSELLASLQTLGMEVNMHAGWTRHRIDKLTEFRGQTHLIAAKYS